MKENLKINYFSQFQDDIYYIYGYCEHTFNYMMTTTMYGLGQKDSKYNIFQNREFKNKEEIDSISKNKILLDRKYDSWIEFDLRYDSHDLLYYTNDDDVQMKYHCTSQYSLDGETVVDLINHRFQILTVNVSSDKIYGIRKKSAAEIEFYLKCE